MEKKKMTFDIYVDDWDYIRTMTALMGETPSSFVRELIHEVVGFMKNAVDEEKTIDVAKVAQLAFEELAVMFKELREINKRYKLEQSE